ncbi:hypothetical protein CJF31_00009552 [Rutstroemia sp. NJR-2017a BVV2]|nr:hypothetical protein CJF31_00009552 [Rutstroemia sp. NJR-2017a BVV2]
MGNKNTRTTKSLGDLRTTGKTLAIPAKANKETESPVTPKTLAFKSYRQGTLITQNFEPVPIKSKPLCATSPEFIPALPVKLDTSMALSGAETTPKKVEVPGSLPRFSAPGMKEFQVHSAMGIQPTNTGIGTPASAFKPIERLMMSTPPGRLQQATRNTMISQFTGTAPNTPSFTATARYRPRSTTFATPTGPGAFGTSPTTLSPNQPLPSPRPTHRRNHSLRADKSLKDIVVSRHGIKHNIFSSTSSHASYNFVETLRSMSGKEREEFWAKNWVEIVVDLNVKEGEHEEEVKGKVENDEKIKQYDFLIQNLELLGPELKTSVQNMLINIIFPEPPLSSSPSTGNKPPPPPIANATSHTTPEFLHLTNLVTYLSLPALSLASLQALTILLTVPNSSKPLSLPQLTLLLPFYDLPFTSWTISWRTSFMTRAEQVAGWPVHYLDRERDRLLRERERARRGGENGGKREDGGGGDVNGVGRGGRGKGGDKGHDEKGAEEGKGLQKGNGAFGE